MNHYTFNDIVLGLEHSFGVVVTNEMFEQFKVMTGDINPLHTELAYATAKGFPDRVVYGMLIASFYSTLVGVYLPGQHALLQGLNTTFHQPVFVGDSLTIYGSARYMNKAYKQIEVKAHITNQNKKKVSKAVIKIGLYE